ncbi:MAG TPA: septum site-determining protein MinC [Candidatus Sulfomarinibacteraceae bacterium]|nr:septum site-determining protein MinC [Candidatus Sulfomarinibacteraceae bacterium]
MTTSSATGIRVKGIREGILLGLPEQGLPYSTLLQELQDELSQKEAFLQGSRVVLDVGGHVLQKGQLMEIQALLAERELELWAVLTETDDTREAARALGLATRLAGSNTDLEGNRLLEATGTPEAVAVMAAESAPDALLLQETLRSGQSVYHEGHVVIIGDVNPGAEVIASGHVVVWGRLRGLVHAGAMGDTSAVICALQLTPTQLRIANQIAIPPDEQPGDPIPEMAAIRDGQIVADAWRSRE